MKSYVLDLGMEVLIHNNRAYVLENGKIKDFFSSVPVLAGDIEIALRNKPPLEVIDETDAFKIYFEDFWKDTKVRDLLMEYFNNGYTIKQAAKIIERAYSRPVEKEIHNVKKIIQKQTGTDWK